MKIQLHQKAFLRETWPSIQLSHDESQAVHQVTNTVNVFDVQNSSAGEIHSCNLKS